jgi:conjugal transfer pilus assembly protein TraF
MGAGGAALVSCLAGVLAGAPALVTMRPAVAQEAGQDYVPGRQWLERGGEGWFWYHDPPAAPREAPPAPSRPVPSPRPPAAAPAAPPPPPGVTAAEAAAPAPLSAAWFRANLDHYREQAIDRPTPDNVASYLYLQRIMLDKADAFAAAAQAVVASDPALDANNERPLGTAAANAVTAIAARAQDHLLGQVAGFAGFLLFLRSDCPICTQQAATLEMLRRQFGFQVMVVSPDGLPPPGAIIPGLLRDAGQAAHLGVRQVPALFMLRPPADVVPVSYGVLTLDDLKTRVLLLARQARWVSDNAWQATQPVAHRSLAPLAALITPDLLADPAALVARIHAALQADPGS